VIIAQYLINYAQNALQKRQNLWSKFFKIILVIQDGKRKNPKAMWLK
jgi:hypothetical protein